MRENVKGNKNGPYVYLFLVVVVVVCVNCVNWYSTCNDFSFRLLLVQCEMRNVSLFHFAFLFFLFSSQSMFFLFSLTLLLYPIQCENGMAWHGMVVAQQYGKFIFNIECCLVFFLFICKRLTKSIQNDFMNWHIIHVSGVLCFLFVFFFLFVCLNIKYMWLGFSAYRALYVLCYALYLRNV